MRKKPKLSGLLNSSPGHRLFSKSIFKSTEYPSPSPLSLMTANYCCLLLPLTIYSAPYLGSSSKYSYLRCVITPVAVHFWNCDITNSFSLVTHHRQTLTIIITSHHTSHRISGIVQRGARNRLSVKDSSPALSRCSAQFLHWFSPLAYASTPLSCSWAYRRLPQSSPPLSNVLFLVHTPPLDVFGIVSCTHAPSSRFLSYSITYIFLCDNGRLEFAPFFPFTSLFFGAVIYYSLFCPPIDSHFDYRFTFDLHTRGSLHLGLANSFLVLSHSRS